MSLLQPLAGRLFLFLFMLFGAVLLSHLSFAVSLSVPKDDSVILAQISAKVASDSDVARFPLDFSVNGGAVRIRGTVPTKVEAMALIILVDSIAGVQAVDISGLSLRKGKIPVDDMINSEVIGTFNREGLMGSLSQQPVITTISGPGNATYSSNPPPMNIQVKTKDAVVYLSGTVPDQAVADKAVNFARSIPGVATVQSSLTVVSP